MKYPLHIANYFNSSKEVKKRITMLYSQKHSKTQLLKFLGIFPLLLLGIMLFAFKKPIKSNVLAITTPQKKIKTTRKFLSTSNTRNENSRTHKAPLSITNDYKIKKLPKYDDITEIKPEGITSAIKNLDINKINSGVSKLKKPIVQEIAQPKDTSKYSLIINKNFKSIQTIRSLILSKNSKYIIKCVNPVANTPVKFDFISRDKKVIKSNNKDGEIHIDCKKTGIYYFAIHNNDKNSANIKVYNFKAYHKRK